MSAAARPAIEVSDSPFPLPDDWAIDEVVDEELVVDGVRLRRAGVTAIGPGGAAVCGSAAELEKPALPRAWFELLERASIITAIHDRELATPDRHARTPSRSSGVALASDWCTACERARCELVERDRILRSWRGEILAEPIVLPDSAIPPTRGYTWRAARLPATDWAVDLEVVAVVAFGRDDSRPLLRGFGAATELHFATQHATGECLQALAFLGPEDVPHQAPAPSPTPIFHLELFLWPGAHAILRDWIDGKPAMQSHPRSRTEVAPVTYLDLTPHWAHGRFRVARAMCTTALPLEFGRSWERDGFCHPIP